MIRVRPTAGTRDEPFRAWRRRFWIGSLGLITCLSGVWLRAAQPAADIHPGESKSEVIKKLGLPISVSKSGGKETLSYPQGHVVLEKGRVDHTDFSTPTTAPAATSVSPEAEKKTPPRENPSLPKPPPSDSAVAAANTLAPEAPIEVSSSLTSARWLIVSALAGGALVSAGLLWLIWRAGDKSTSVSRHSSISTRISEAASGVPTAADIAAWSKDRLSIVTARLAEAQGYRAVLRTTGECDIVLNHPSNAKPSVFVCCSPGSAGAVSAKRLRDFVGTLAIEGVLEGWFVSPAGFAFDARIYAEEPTLLLIDGDRLLDQLRDLPPLLLERVLAHG